MSNADVVRKGFKGFPECEVCQCYPECRNDCPGYLQCVERLPEYADRVFGSDRSTWPASIRAVWEEKGWKTWAEERAYLLESPRREGSMTVTTQQTGKLFKAMQAIGVLIMLGGTVACVSGTEAGAMGAIVSWMVGPLVYGAGRIAAWWWHG